MASTQSTVPSQTDGVFSPPQTQSTQPTQSFQQSFAPSTQACEEERRDTGDSFVSAKEAFGSKKISEENLRATYNNDAVEIDDTIADDVEPETHEDDVHPSLGSDHDSIAIDEIPTFPSPPRPISEAYSISADTHAALDTADERAQAPEPKILGALVESFAAPTRTELEEVQHEDTITRLTITWMWMKMLDQHLIAPAR